MNSLASAQLFDFYPDVPLSETMNDLIVFRNVLDVAGSRDLQEIPDGSGRFLSMRGTNFVQIVSPGEDDQLYLEAGNLPQGPTEGALSLAIHPDFANTGTPGFGRLYTLTVDLERDGDPDFISPNPETFSHYVITEWKQNDPGANKFSGSSREIMRFKHGSQFHNTNQLLFGPNDDYLYIAVGDDLAEEASADLGSAFGKILRIDPLGSNSDNGEYGIPSDNPFVNDANALDEIFAYGARNPWRMGFDRETGDLYGGEIGLSSVEEVNRYVAGNNYGWPFKEGTFLAGRPPLDEDLADSQTGQTLAESKGLTDPLFELDRSEMNAIMGLVAYRGERFPELQGKLIFGAWNHFRVYAGDPDTGEVEVIVEGDRLKSFMDEKRFVSINEDLEGEIYLSGGNQIVSLFSLPDFDRSGEYDTGDIDGICDALGTRSSQFDLNGDLRVDNADMAQWFSTTNSLVGDVNVDGRVNFSDFTLFAANYLLPDAKWSQGDVNCDDVVTFEDYLVIVRNFGRSAAATQAVPEPESLCVSLVGVLLLSLVRRRRPR